MLQETVQMINGVYRQIVRDVPYAIYISHGISGSNSDPRCPCGNAFYSEKHLS